MSKKSPKSPSRVEPDTSHALLMQALDSADKNMISKAVQYSVAVALSAIAVPKGTEIDALSKMNPRTPVYFSVWLAYEERVNALLGTVRATGKPLYRPMSFFSDVIQVYMRITPSTGKSPKNRAEMILETMGKGALAPVEDMKHSMPDSRRLETPEERSRTDRILGRNKSDD